MNQFNKLIYITAVGLVLAIMLPPIGFIICVTVLIKYKTLQFQGKTLAKIGAVLGGLLSVPLLIIASVLFQSGVSPLKNNTAETLHNQAVSASDLLNKANLECSNGNNGYGIANRLPWYVAYYVVDDADSIGNDLSQWLRSNGYSLYDSDDHDPFEIDQRAHLHQEDGAYKYIGAIKENNTVQVHFYKNTSVSLRCDGDVDEYGRIFNATNDKTLVQIRTTTEITD